MDTRSLDESSIGNTSSLSQNEVQSMSQQKPDKYFSRQEMFSQDMQTSLQELTDQLDQEVSTLSGNFSPTNEKQSQGSYDSSEGTVRNVLSSETPKQEDSSISLPSEYSNPYIPTVKIKVYPKQTVVHKLNSIYLLPGSDGFYYEDRDYTLLSTIAEGEFSICILGKDHSTDRFFAMRKSKAESIYSLKQECNILTQLEPHDHIIRFFGAVIDEHDNFPEYKMFMEYADNDTLASLLITEPGVKEPLPLDQSLYYIEQILQGVHFLHQNSLLHLRINAGDVLLFDNGRTVKLSGFSTAVHVSDAKPLSGHFPYFAAPEAIRGDKPVFKSDIWSVMCLLVELLTTRLPWCHERTISVQRVIWLLGNYQDSDIERMIPFSKYKKIDPEIEQLLRQVFIVDSAKRPSALTLLNHPRIKGAREYRKIFDEWSDPLSLPSETIDDTTQASSIVDIDALHMILYDSGVEVLSKDTPLSLESVQQKLLEKGLQELATNLSIKLDQAIKQQREYLQRLEDLMASKDTIYIQCLRLFLIGPPFVGKTTTLNRLLGKFENILTAGERAKLQSTLLANCTQVLAFVSDDTAKWLSSNNIDEETVFLYRFLCGVKTEEILEQKEVAIEAKNVTKPTKENFEQQAKPANAVDFSDASESVVLADTNKSSAPEASFEPRALSNELIAIKSRLQKLIKSGNHFIANYLLSNTLLNINDVGGQPGFLEMLPALSQGPAMYMVFLDLSKELDKRYKIPFSRDETVITPFDAVHTVESTISQILSAIASVHYISREPPPVDISKVSGFKVKFEKFLHNEPRAILIGTHKDKLQNPDTKIKQVDQALRKTTSKFSKFMVVPGNCKASFFSVNNYSGTEQSDIAPLRNFMTDIFSTHFKQSTLPIRKKWLIMSILLRREFCIVKLEDCIKIGELFDMDEEETKFCLWYLHDCIGTLLHYTRILEDDDGWFKNHVICSPQVIFDSISQLILASLRTLHSEGSVTEYEREELIKKGQFSLESIEKYCTSTQVAEKLDNQQLIPAKQLVVLLKHVNLLSPITHCLDHDKIQTTYLMPAVLECASEQQMTSPCQVDNNNPESVFLVFDFGYVPTGVFCSLITRLVSQGPGGIFGFEWTLNEDGIKRNFVPFTVDHVHKVTLLSHEKCYEIRITREDPSISLHDLCAYAQLTILFNLQSLYKNLLPRIAFRCHCTYCQPSSEQNLLCTLSEGSRIRFLCNITKKPVTLPLSQKVWLGKHVAIGESAELEVLKDPDTLQQFFFHWTREGSRHPVQTDKPHAIGFVAVCAEDFGYYVCKMEVARTTVITLYKGLYRKHPSEDKAEQKATMTLTVAEASFDCTKYLGKLRKLLWDVRAKWEDLGIDLGIAVSTCEAIDVECRGKVDKCFTALLKEWLQDQPKLEDLLEALKSPVLGRADLADELEAKIKAKELVLW